jgi:hypothetical protein
VRIDPIVRAGVVGLCIAGVVASAITYRSQQRIVRAFGSALENTPRANTIRLANSSQTLHPDTRADFAKAIYALFHHDRVHAVSYARNATRREPQNAAAWLALARIEVGVGAPKQGGVAYTRAKALDSQLPRTPLP